MKKLVLIMMLSIFAPVMGNCSLSTNAETEMYPGDKKRKRKVGFNYRQHRRWVKGYPKCKMN